jgi:hypothetical protein
MTTGTPVFRWTSWQPYALVTKLSPGWLRVGAVLFFSSRPSPAWSAIRHQILAIPLLKPRSSRTLRSSRYFTPPKGFASTQLLPARRSFRVVSGPAPESSTPKFTRVCALPSLLGVSVLPRRLRTLRYFLSPRAQTGCPASASQSMVPSTEACASGSTKASCEPGPLLIVRLIPTASRLAMHSWRLILVVRHGQMSKKGFTNGNHIEGASFDGR